MNRDLQPVGQGGGSWVEIPAPSRTGCKPGCHGCVVRSLANRRPGRRGFVATHPHSGSRVDRRPFCTGDRLARLRTTQPWHPASGLTPPSRVPRAACSPCRQGGWTWVEIPAPSRTGCKQPVAYALGYHSAGLRARRASSPALRPAGWHPQGRPAGAALRVRERGRPAREVPPRVPPSSSTICRDSRQIAALGGATRGWPWRRRAILGAAGPPAARPVKQKLRIMFHPRAPPRRRTHLTYCDRWTLGRSENMSPARLQPLCPLEVGANTVYNNRAMSGGAV